MQNRIIVDISKYIFVFDELQKVDAIFLPGGSHPEQPEYAAQLYQMAFQDVSFIVRPVHCYNITKDNWYTTEEGIDRVLGELTRCGNEFVTDVKNYLK